MSILGINKGIWGSMDQVAISTSTNLPNIVDVVDDNIEQYF